MPQPSRQFSGVFICYRRDDSSGHAVHLFHVLGEQLKGERVFMDIDMGPGEEFARKIEREVGSCELLIALIGKQWLGLRDGEGRRRLEDPVDYVRLEIATALAGGKVVLPVLVDGARIPAAGDLPDNIAGLPSRQYFELRNQTWNGDVRQLARDVKRKLAERRAEELERKKRAAAEEERERREARRLARRLAAGAAPATPAAVRPVPKVNDSVIIFSGVLQLVMLAVGATYLTAYLLALGGSPEPFKADTPVFVPVNFHAFPEKINDKIYLEMEAIPGDRVLLGTPPGEEKPAAAPAVGPNDVDVPLHSVRVESFYIGKYEVTQAQWRAVMGKDNNPSKFKGDNLPVDSVPLYDAMAFCNFLSKLTEKEYRLPTEDEWEYACRAKTHTPFALGWSLSSQEANFNGNYPYGMAEKGEYRQQTMSVESFQPNAFGLYNMHGNVWEWCNDSGGGLPGRVKALRGGAWDSPATSLRSGHRLIPQNPAKGYPTYGFRVALDAR